MINNNLAATSPNAISTQKDKQPKTLSDYLHSAAVIAKLSEVASATMKPEALVRMTLMAASRNEQLARCTRDSVLRALLDAAELGIAPGGLQGRGYLVPRNNRKNNTVECHFDPGWRGLVDIARRSGKIQSFSAHVVHEKDRYEVTFGIDERIDHKPYFGGDPGPVVGAYAVARFRDGGHQVEFVSRADLEKVRMASESGRNGNGPWGSWFDEMARKTAVRRLCKYLPFEPEIEHAVRASIAADGGDADDLMADAIENGVSKAKALEAKLTAPASTPAVDSSPAPSSEGAESKE